MKSLYFISIAGADQNVGHLILTNTQYCLPSVVCTKCGDAAVSRGLWRTTWQCGKTSLLSPPSHRDTPLKVISSQEYWNNVVPHLETHDEYPFPGSYLGGGEVPIPEKAKMSVLCAKHIQAAQPIIFAGSAVLFRSDIAEHVAIDTSVKLGRVLLKSKKISRDYYVLESPLLMTWSDAEHDSYGMSHCAECGTTSFKKRGGTYRIRPYRSKIFGDSPRIVQCLENDAVVINEAMKYLFEQCDNRITFAKCGECE